MADSPEGSFTHTLEEIDTGVSEVENAKGDAASLAAAITAAAETAASTAVGNLDYSEVGGTGKYISAIKEENGIIVPTASNIAASVSSTNANAVSSKAVYTAISGKIGIADVFGLGTEITDNTNLDSLTSPGIYYRPSNQNSTIGNIPIDGYAFKLITEYINSNIRRRQTFIPLSATAEYYIRIQNSGGWQTWYRFAGTAVTPPASQASLNPSAQLQVTPPDDDEMR